MKNKKGVIVLFVLAFMAPGISIADVNHIAAKKPWRYAYTCPQGWHVDAYGQEGQQTVKLVGQKRSDLKCKIDRSFVDRVRLDGRPASITTDYAPFPEKRWNNIKLGVDRPLLVDYTPTISPDKPFFQVQKFGTDRPLALDDLWIRFNNIGVSANSSGIQISSGKIWVSLDVLANNGCTPPDQQITPDKYFDYIFTTVLHPTVHFGLYRETFDTTCTKSFKANISKAYLPALSPNELQARCDIMNGKDTWAFAALDVIADQNAGQRMAQRTFRKKLWIKISCTDDFVPYKRNVKAKVAEYEHSCFDYGDNYYIIGIGERTVITDNPTIAFQCIEGKQESIDAGKG